MATAWRGHAVLSFMPTQSGGHATHHIQVDGLLLVFTAFQRFLLVTDL
jgi:hypothetical protein